MSQNIFVSIDGGGSKTRVRVEDSDGQLLGQAVGGPVNICSSVDEAWHTLLKILNGALQPQKISLQDKQFRFHVGMGLVDGDVAEPFREYVNHLHPFTSLLLTSDAHVACVGAHAGRDGAIIIVGNDVIGYQIQNNQGVKVGGWGFLNDDGGGAWLGLEAVRLTFQWLDHRIEKTPLLQDVFAFFDNDLDHFVTWSHHASANEYARLAPLIINHSQQEDPSAVKLMKKAAHAITRVGAALEKQQSDRESPLACCLSGGLAPFMEAWLSDELRARLVPRQADATAGAMLMIRHFVERSASVVNELCD